MRALYEITGDTANLLHQWEAAQLIEDEAEREAAIEQLDAAVELAEEEFDAKAENYAKAMRNLEHLEEVALAEAKGFEDEAKRHRAHAKAHRSKRDWLKLNLKLSMERLGRKRVDGEQLSVTLQNVKASVVVDDLTAVPASFLLPQPPKADTKALYAALKEGPVLGCRLEANSTVVVR